MSDQGLATQQANEQFTPDERTESGQIARGVISMPMKLATLLRAPAALALTMPILCGAILGWWEQGVFDLGNFLIALLGSLSGALSINALWEYFDFRNGLSVDHGGSDLLPDTAYSLMRNGRINATLTRNLGLIFGAVGLACSILLALLAGWPMLFFAGLSFVLALFYAAPPIRYGYRGWGLGEVGVFISFGLLPVLGGYYALTQQLSQSALWATLPLGLLSVLVIYTYNLLRYHRDWLIRKRTLVVSVGIPRSLDIGIVLTIAAYSSFILASSIGTLPLWTLLSLGGLPLMLGGFSDIWRGGRRREDLPRLYATAINGVIVTALLFCLSLFLDRLL